MDPVQSFRRIHFIGIAGAGMSALASVLLHRGFEISGSDLVCGSVAAGLTRAGARVELGHRAGNLGDADLVVVSTAIREDNPELIEAERRGLPIWHRARMLGEVMRVGRGLAVSGTHGKTTVTSMMGMTLIEAGMDPTILIGGDLPAIGGNARHGLGEWTVAEADESDASLLALEPDRVILTNIEGDHLDHYRDLDHITATFAEFIGRMKPGGRLVACMDSPPAAELIARVAPGALSYSLADTRADLYAADMRAIDGGEAVEFTPVHRGERLAPVRLATPGDHNVTNALGVILMALDMGCPQEAAASALAHFTGARRRFELKGAAGGVTIYDDYAHHPTEVRATLAAARARIAGRGDARVVAVFQPHRYTRTQVMAAQFGAAFGDADLTILTGIYAAGEDPIEGVSGRDIYDRALADGQTETHYVARREDVAAELRSRLRPGDLVLTMGAGDIWKSGEELLALLRESAPGAGGDRRGVERPAEDSPAPRPLKRTTTDRSYGASHTDAPLGGGLA